MLSSRLDGRNIAYDLVGPETAPVVCMTHSLASDGGMWTEQVPPLLAAGFRVLRIDMRGHGGSGPVAGDYTMSALAADVAAVLDALSIARVHFIGLSIGGMLGQAFALEHGGRLASAMWCDTLPATPAGAPEVWQQRVDTVRRANSLAPLADPTIERWLTDAVQQSRPGTLEADPRHHHRHHAGGLSRLRRRDPQLRLRGAAAVAEAAGAGGVRVGRCGHAAGRATGRSPAWFPAARYEEIADARHFPNVEHPDTFNRIMLGWLNAQR